MDQVDVWLRWATFVLDPSKCADFPPGCMNTLVDLPLERPLLCRDRDADLDTRDEIVGGPVWDVLGNLRIAWIIPNRTIDGSSSGRLAGEQV